jgi:cellulose synthase/poly-beta-1,6-N-acetylglucosamine synthase-like glycosyltransferase
MSVYAREKAVFLRESMDSMWSQTIPPSDFVLVCDGPLTNELEVVINQQREVHDNLRLIRLAKNCGLHSALNEGLKHCLCDLVARMDSDDISYSDRCEKQLKLFALYPDLGIVSGTVEEFSGSTTNITGIRTVPSKHSDIIEFSKRRNPFNHPCVMYRKNNVLAAGGYRSIYLLEDYDLWVRMLNSGVTGANIKDPLLYMRAGFQLYKRRSGGTYLCAQIAFFWNMLMCRYTSFPSFAATVSVRLIATAIPNSWRILLFKSFRNDKTKHTEVNV